MKQRQLVAGEGDSSDEDYEEDESVVANNATFSSLQRGINGGILERKELAAKKTKAVVRRVALSACVTASLVLFLCASLPRPLAGMR